MPLIATPAIVLKVTPYSETSKIVRLLTRDHGLVSALARGATPSTGAAPPFLVRSTRQTA